MQYSTGNAWANDKIGTDAKTLATGMEFWSRDANVAANNYAGKALNFTMVDNNQVQFTDLPVLAYMDMTARAWLGWSSKDGATKWEQKPSTITLAAWTGATTLAATATAAAAALALF